MAPVTMTTGQSLVSYGGMSVGQARITNPTKPGIASFSMQFCSLFGPAHDLKYCMYVQLLVFTIIL